jgi:hypothetical protein
MHFVQRWSVLVWIMQQLHSRLTIWVWTRWTRGVIYKSTMILLDLRRIYEALVVDMPVSK